MALYRVAKSPAAYADSVLCLGLEAASAEVRAAGFEGASVWRYCGQSRHWSLIFDRSLPESGRLSAALHWCNIAQNEKARK